MRTVLVTGVQGVGKSTVNCLAAQALGLQGWDYADLMMRVAPEVRHKDDLQYLVWSDRVQIYRKVEKLLAELFWPGDGTNTCVLLENHLSILDEGGIHTFPHEDARRYNPVGLVVVEASPEEVLERRRADRQRNRYIGSLAEVTEQQQINRQEAALIGELISVPITTIINNERTQAAQQLVEWISAVLR
ncbi:MAG: AAA family ATPase [Pseudonocardiaceae bacterium]